MGRQSGYRLAEERKRRGLTQADLAQAMRVPAGRVSGVERGELATIDAVARYGEALGGRRRLRVIAPARSRGITVAVTFSNTASSRVAAPQFWGQYRTNSSMPISLKRPTMSRKYSTDRQGVSGGKQTRECRIEAGSRPAATHRSSKRWLRSAVTA